MELELVGGLVPEYGRAIAPGLCVERDDVFFLGCGRCHDPRLQRVSVRPRLARAGRQAVGGDAIVQSIETRRLIGICKDQTDQAQSRRADVGSRVTPYGRIRPCA